MVIQREIYLDRLISKMHNGLIKVITGIRRSGKSYLLFQLYYEYLLKQGVEKDHIIRISLEDIDNIEYCDPIKLYQHIKEQITNESEQYYIFLDEVQYTISKEEMQNKDMPIKLYGVLNGLLKNQNVDVYVTGSNSKFLSSDIMTEFRGRGDEIHVAPLSFSEFYPAHSGSVEEAWKDYTYYGGLPHILMEQGVEAKSNYLSRLNEEIYLRDITERYGIANPVGMEELMKVIASAIGSLSNPQRISDTFQSKGMSEPSLPTITKYLTFLIEAFIVEKAERYDIKGRKYINTPFKYYYTDIGLRNALLNFRQYEINHIMENIIYNELIYRGFKVDVGIVEISQGNKNTRVRKQLEVDFVANQGNKRYYIQSAFSIPDQEKMEQEQASLVRIPDSFKKIIVVNDNLPLRRNDQGIMIINIFDFLLNRESLDL